MIQRRSPFTNTSLSSRKHDTCEVGEKLQEVSWSYEGATLILTLTSPLFSMSHLFIIFMAYTWPVCFIFTTAT